MKCFIPWIVSRLRLRLVSPFPFPLLGLPVSPVLEFPDVPCDVKSSPRQMFAHNERLVVLPCNVSSWMKIGGSAGFYSDLRCCIMMLQRCVMLCICCLHTLGNTIGRQRQLHHGRRVFAPGLVCQPSAECIKPGLYVCRYTCDHPSS